ncbi:MAG: crossover junction endodeoxyribonuclease RuvC [Candidatus Kerfeldbacteria bacterium RIFOXYA2_FULL_38_24]|uniref:Crossover junction endodeoxyribonuclease RuvC n=1 Tax=Candidatus Kerfeldbacteria bacterium RIFOXYB2_FULL_38_14 TaxID=1798547 RepID=A0A1G2BBC6_9BACT|nr:MAG: crossover junction endodeoxyribonuclease RuvC [Candidatus Kerfeldbacteria bacterium RIFOXYA2_FULL_38_24]OGY86528.1 MAG: crossover junction endodeoxyribonuclease RuvC [Candidatus Kerfeldbacteria bacterium RIFOXYB2_FULL_38_14]OGY89267.1 MAG: crossover junction endodeoxyribonuclease RuvC [Candidatus Kerfeldbacteria bacterium RIFOXYC2_FULL_38_9]
MKILGIDPGIETIGFAIIENQSAGQSLLECGVIKTSSQDLVAKRLQDIHQDLTQILKRHQDIVLAGVEELFFAKNTKTACNVWQARGLILFTLQEFGLTIKDIKPNEVKMAVTGSGRADKKEMQKMIQLRFGLDQPPQPDDAADAAAIAITAAAFKLS